MFAVVADAAGQGADELVVGPGADPGLLIRRDVGGDDNAERGLDRAPAGKIATASAVWQPVQSPATAR